MSPTALMARLFMRKREEETIEKRDEPDAHKTSRQYSSSVRRLTSLNLYLAFKMLVPSFWYWVPLDTPSFVVQGYMQAQRGELDVR